jgi:thiamine transport system permease protein
VDSGLDGGNVAVKYPRKITPAWQAALLWLLPALFLGCFYFLPLIEIIKRSGIIEQGIHLAASEWSIITKPLSLTILQAVVSTALTLCIGIPGAYVLSHYGFPGRELIKAVLIVPFILPTVVVSACFTALLGPHGLINELLMLLFHLGSPPILLLNSFWAIILGHVFYNTSIIILILAEAWSRLNPNYSACARILGANRLQTAFKVTMPLLAPALLSAALLVFIFDFTSFGVVLLMGGPMYATLEVEIYVQAIQMLNFRMATILSMIQIALTLALSIVYARISRNQSFELVPNFRSGHLLKNAPFSQKAFSLGVLTVLFLVFFTPLVALLLRSFTSYTDNPSGVLSFVKSITWSYYAELFINRSHNLFFVPPFRAILNSVLFALITVAVTIPLGILVVLALKRPYRINGLLGSILMLPLGTSAVTLGLGLVLAFNTTDLYRISFPILLPISHALVALPMVVRILQPSISSIPVTLNQSARLLGSNPWQVFKYIDLPLLRGPILVSAVFAFSISLGEFGATTFLNRPEYPTIPIAIFRFLTYPGQMNYGQAMAMSSILMVLCILSILIIQITARRNPVGQ